jgi:hypothetical protein
MSPNPIIFDAFSWTAIHRPDYLKAIESRPTGSQWVGGVIPWQQLAAWDWQQLPLQEYRPGLHSEDCLYFSYRGFQLNGSTQAFKLLSEFQDYSSVQLVQGAHGVELVSHLVSRQYTCDAWLILGQAKTQDGQVVRDRLMVFAAYPGALTASIKRVPGFDGTLESLIQAANQGYAIAVKGLPS